MTNLEERIKKLVGDKSEKLKNDKEIIQLKKNGGKRAGSGRKPKEANIIARGIKSYLDNHFQENVKIEIEDPKTGKKVIVSKPRIVYALEKLYEIGTRTPGDPDALNKWLDRALGKPIQPIGGDEDKPILIKIDF